jgi:hypothetical protein
MPQDPQNQQNTQAQPALNRDSNSVMQGMQDQTAQQPQAQVTPQDPAQAPQSAPAGDEPFIPYAAFPATMQREYDPGIYNMIAELVDKKYGAELVEAARDFEIKRVYNKLEIEMFELSTFQLPKDKQDELQKMTESAGGAANQQDVILKIREYMQVHVPNITDIVNQYMLGFRNQYMAGRY